MDEPIKELLQFNAHQIIALQRELHKSNSRIVILESYLLGLTEKDCPEEYKQIIRNEIFKP